MMSAMASQHPNVPVKYDNVTFNQPDTMWSAFCVMDGHAMAVNIGTQKVDRHLGFVQFDAMAPANTGSSQAVKLAEFGGSLFREQNVLLTDNSRVIFKVPSIITIGLSGGFFRMCMRCSYWRDEALA